MLPCDVPKSVMSAETFVTDLPPEPLAAMSSLVLVASPTTAAFTLRVPPRTVRLPVMVWAALILRTP